MGISISEEQYQKLEANRREGRLCAMSTGRGGCFNRATWTEEHESWAYKIGEGAMDVSTMVFCGSHRNCVGYEGTNFRVIAVSRLPRSKRSAA